MSSSLVGEFRALVEGEHGMRHKSRAIRGKSRDGPHERSIAKKCCIRDRLLEDDVGGRALHCSVVQRTATTRRTARSLLLGAGRRAVTDKVQ